MLHFKASYLIIDSLHVQLMTESHSEKCFYVNFESNCQFQKGPSRVLYKKYHYETKYSTIQFVFCYCASDGTFYCFILNDMAIPEFLPWWSLNRWFNHNQQHDVECKREQFMTFHWTISFYGMKHRIDNDLLFHPGNLSKSTHHHYLFEICDMHTKNTLFCLYYKIFITTHLMCITRSSL